MGRGVCQVTASPCLGQQRMRGACWGYDGSRSGKHCSGSVVGQGSVVDLSGSLLLLRLLLLLVVRRVLEEMGALALSLEERIAELVGICR